MPVIDPKGLFEGQRLAACSDRAQSSWPRLYCAANGYARLELHAPSIIGRCFAYFQDPPSVEQLMAAFVEYAENFLVIPYQVRGQFWIQFATEDKFLRRRKTADDERSPAPPPESLETFHVGYAAWKERQHQESASYGDSSILQKFPNYFRNPSKGFSPGVGVGIGIGIGVGEGNGDGEGEKLLAHSDEKDHRSTQEVEPTIFDLPLIGDKKYGVPQKLYDEYVAAYPGVSVMGELSRMRTWLLSNPNNRKTPKGIPRFMNAWLAKAQNNQPQPRGGRNDAFLPIGKADRNLAILAEALRDGKHQSRVDETGLLQAGSDG